MVTRLVVLSCLLAGCYDLDGLATLYHPDMSANMEPGDDGFGFVDLGDGGSAGLQLELWAGKLGGSGSSNAIGTSARLDHPYGVTYDETRGVVYITTGVSSTITTYDLTSGQVTVVAGRPYHSNFVDGVFGVNELRYPEFSTLVNGKLYVVEALGHVRTYDRVSGLVGTAGVMLGNLGGGVTTDGTSLFFADTAADTITSSVPPFTSSTLLGGSMGNPGYKESPSSMFNGPRGIAWAMTKTNATELLVADQANEVVRMVSPTTMATSLVSGTPKQPCANPTDWCMPMGITVDTDGTLYVSDQTANTLRKVDPSGSPASNATDVAGTHGENGSADATGTLAHFFGPSGIAATPQGIVIADQYNGTLRLYDTTTKMVTTIVGQPAAFGSNDGPGLDARFNFPSRMVLSGEQIILADTNNGLLRNIDESAKVATLADMSKASGCGIAAGPATANALAVASDGTLYILDANRNVIIKLPPGGTPTIVCATGGGAPLRGFGNGTDIALDGDDDLYVADNNANQLVHLRLSEGTSEPLPITPPSSGATRRRSSATRRASRSITPHVVSISRRQVTASSSR